MTRPLTLHLKATLLCASGALVLALPLLWAPLLPSWHGWRPPLVSPRAEAIVALVMAFWTAWCVVDIPRRGLKVLVWLGTLWLLGSGIWLSDLYGYSASSLVPVAAAAIAGAAGIAFSLTPAGSRRARWQSLVGKRVDPEFLRARIDEQYLDESPRSAVLVVAQVLWPVAADDERSAWEALGPMAESAARHFQPAGAYLERCDGEGALFVFGCWGRPFDATQIVRTLWDWVGKAGGCAAVVQGECTTGVARFPAEVRWAVGGAPLRRAARMAAAARSYAARLVADHDFVAMAGDDWRSRRLVWWDFEGKRLLLREITGPSAGAEPGGGDDLRRWDRAWEAFWNGDWLDAENGFASLAREREDAAARIFALRSAAARRHEAEL